MLAFVIGAVISVVLDERLKKFFAQTEYEKTNSSGWRFSKALTLGVLDAAAYGLPLFYFTSDLPLARSAALALGIFKFAGSWEIDNLLLKMVVLLLGIGTAVYIWDGSLMSAVFVSLMWLALAIGFVYVLFNAMSKSESGKNKNP